MSIGVRLHIFVRSLMCPFVEIESLIPKKGKILDVGCGHGTFSHLLAKQSKTRQVIGIDPSVKKIREAKKIYRAKNLIFKSGYLQEIKGKFSAVSIVDVLYLLPQKEKLKVFKEAFNRLESGGVLLLVFFNKETSQLMYKILLIQERLMVNLLQATFSKYNKFHFLTSSEYKNLLKNTGFEIKNLTNLIGTLPYPLTVITALKK